MTHLVPEALLFLSQHIQQLSSLQLAPCQLQTDLLLNIMFYVLFNFPLMWLQILYRSPRKCDLLHFHCLLKHFLSQRKVVSSFIILFYSAPAIVISYFVSFQRQFSFPSNSFHVLHTTLVGLTVLLFFFSVSFIVPPFLNMGLILLNSVSFGFKKLLTNGFFRVSLLTSSDFFSSYIFL